MKNYIKIVAGTFLFIFFSQTATAQKGAVKFDLNYNYSIPVNGFKSDLISNSSPRGIRGGLTYSLNDQLSLGIESGWQDYYQKYPRATYSIGKSQDISAVLSNSIQTTPFLLKANYSLLKSAPIKPFISVGAGANLIDFNQYFGEFVTGNTSVGFIAQGGLGVMIPFRKNSGSAISISGNYDYSPYKKFGYNDLNTINLQAGVVFKIE